MATITPTAPIPPTSGAETPLVSDRLTYFGVDQLFGEFTYQIPLYTEERITAIIAPNGSGKTLCLRLINAFFNKRWSYFNEVLFERVEFRFRSGHRVSVTKSPLGADPEEGASLLRVKFSVLVPNEPESIDWIPGWNPGAATSRFPLERYLPFLTRMTPTRWRHDHSGDTFSLLEVIELFGEGLPESFKKVLYADAPPILISLINGIDCHLIETQRLLILRDEQEDIAYRQGRRPASTLAISKKAQSLRAIIAQELTAYAALSQSLDRSFPRRVIRQQKVLPPENLKIQLHELDESRQHLMDAGILDTEADNPVSLPEGPMEEAISRVLSVYAADTRTKLSSLSTLLERIQLFKKLISQRFSAKVVSVSKDGGFEVTFRNNKVPLEKLSSGEQHQLVLFFELLFELKENALILIDEPELSLHVAWQKQFISDLKRIISLNRFDVILATHSPQLISHWTDLVIELGKVDD